MRHSDPYESHPEVRADRRLSAHPSAWVRSFACEDVQPLVVCRGPIRKEALDVFRDMGITKAGILLSERDSIVYPNALAPELRCVRPEHVHRVRDYTGATTAERAERIAEIIAICRAHGYTHVFAGYGFMSEDEALSGSLERAGIGFIGPRARVMALAGKKDEAKRTAIRVGVSVTPGISDITTRLVVRKFPTHAALRAAAIERALAVPEDALSDERPLSDAAQSLLVAAHAARIDLYSLDELCDEMCRAATELFQAHPGRRIRLKAIGGGGGKGQRILAAPTSVSDATALAEAVAQVPGAVREVLAEVKALGVGDDKNVLLELNVESTRHNEIQLLGNGRWCISLGGRDCSVQMHEQKLLEVSITREGLEAAIAEARRAGRDAAARSLEDDLAVLCRMEEEAERFGLAVGLDSASTFECIVEDARHYFMEVNTRIQVEHRVSELCYALRFTNPDDPSDFFDVRSLVEAMVLLARHGTRLPRPTRIPRHGAAVEARLNATDRSLSPHAGGLVQSWTPPLNFEIRDDQGICIPNPDTGAFVDYRLAGAYDSNIALLVTYGVDRRQSFEHLLEILRRMKIEGIDLQTNNAFHYGLVHWLLSYDVWARPTTRFVLPYLTQVGLVACAARDIDLSHLWARLADRRIEAARSAGAPNDHLDALRRIVTLQETLLLRPIRALFDDPHVLMGWLARHRQSYVVDAGRVRWRAHPFDVLADTYWLLNMDPRDGAPAAHVIWDHDRDLLERARGFYRQLEERLAGAGACDDSWHALSKRLEDSAPPAGFDDALWSKVRGAHAGFTAMLSILDVLPLLAERTHVHDLRVEADLTITIPERLLDPDLQAAMKRVLSPPPPTRANEIVAASGGMFYSREAPHLPPLVQQGTRFAAGQPLYVIEVMKMFNKVLAPFSGTIDEVLVPGDGTIVQKGQPLFRVTPDGSPTEEVPETREARRRAVTEEFLAALV